MGTTINTFECKMRAAAMSARRCIQKYSEDAPEQASVFGAKSLSNKARLCRKLQKGGV